MYEFANFKNIANYLFINTIGSDLNFDIDWLIDYLQFYVPFKNFSLIWRRHHCQWRAAKFRPMLGAQGLWAGRDLYRATPAVTRDSVFPVSSEGPPHLVASYDTRGDVEDLF
jgi:hypothetical protein